MKFKNFILEDQQDKKEIFKKILEMCPDLLESNSKLLMRGTKKIKDDFVILSTRKDRAPKDIDKKVHEILNEAFYDKFKIKLRSETVFATQKKVSAIYFGPVFYIFPINKAKYYTSSKIGDLFGFLNEPLSNNVDFNTKEFARFRTKWHNELEDLRIYASVNSMFEGQINLELVTDYLKCIPSLYKKYNEPANVENSEQMIDCEEYILVKKDLFPSVFKTYKELKDYMKLELR